MRQYLFVSLIIVGILITSMTTTDPYLWLEDVEGEKALTWVKARNQTIKERYESRTDFQEIYERSLSILDSPEKILYPRILGPDVYNFWRDKEHERGILRRQPLDQFVNGSDDWQTVLDLDALAEDEGENWVYQGHTPLGPDYRRTLLWLSRGGSDASVMREFDLAEGSFIDGGFELPEAKSNVTWKDQNSLYVATDFGPDSMTNSGYPRILKVWRRGTPLKKAKVLLKVEKDDVSVSAWVSRRPEGEYHFVNRAIDFWNSERFLVVKGKLKPLPIPSDARIGEVFKGELLLKLRSPWKRKDGTFPAGSVLSLDIKALMRGKARAKVLHNPAQDEGTVVGLYPTADSMIVTLSRDVQAGLHRFWLEDGKWCSEAIGGTTGGSAAMAGCTHFRNDFFFSYQDWLTPTRLNYHRQGETREVQRLPERFRSEGLVSEQHWATSADGTRVPYYVVRSGKLKFDGKAPTLLYGYGGFEVSLLPTYLSLAGSAWLERGGVYVSANIRGGGEFGPSWHQAALRENRPRAFEDFEAVAQDLIKRKITSPQHLGIHGRSNGGLLMGAAMTRRPDLYEAVLVGVPLLDMKRYTKLLAGASWIAEYGDPDKPEDWAFLKTYSPYHNLDPSKDYPVPLLYTSTKDDRVHPGHARKMAAKMTDQGHRVEYYENLEGGHAGSSNNAQTAYVTALSYSYLWERLGPK